jgi:8-oxo-dGTP pyrophosphatase MutT (NUDIX family)
MDILQKIQTVLNSRAPHEIDNRSGELIHAAVLIPIFESDGGYKVLFTERTHKVEHHKGQISFPGGAADPDDKDFKETALRETFEEVGLRQQDVRVLGRLDDQLTVASNFIVHPFVGVFPYPYSYSINKNEVERIISFPLDVFMDKNSHLHPRSIDFNTFVYEGPAYRYDDVTIWGATAKIMSNLMVLISAI